MKQVLVDTSVIIDFLRVSNKEKTRFVSLLQQDFQLAISIVTHTELCAGKSVWEKAKAKEELKTLFSGLKILPLDKKISQKAGHIKANHKIDLLDAIIAATAIEYKLLLATVNTKHFKRIKGLRIY